jgi:two-component system LytT family response regulator
MTEFRVLVVDDEPLALTMAASLVREDSDFTDVVECGDAGQVPDFIAKYQPHILLLDIEMPGVDGLQLARNLGEGGPVVVFITAFSHYATRAFDVSAVDYVTKPFSDARLREALDRAKRRVRERRLGELATQVASLSAELSPARNAMPAESTYLQRLAFKVGDRSVVLKPTEIVWVEAEDYYAMVHSTRGRHLVRIPLTTLEQKLDPKQFVRVHRGALVNIEAIREIDQKDGMWLKLSDGARVPVSRSRRRRVEELVVPRIQ